MQIVVGVSGGIAAYKSAELVRQLRKAEHDVRVVMTEGAQAFITPLTLQNLSGHPVQTELLDSDNEALFSHIELARWAELILIAPATAHVMAKLAHGFADDLLSTLCLASEAKLALAPAMNRIMWQAPANQANIATLNQRGALILGPASGEQACGEQGQGRMLEPADLVEAIEHRQYQPFKGLKLLISAGPTREDIDPVRYISNRSSGKMGYALAQVASQMGAQVSLVSGPVSLATPSGVKRIDVYSAADMYSACLSTAPEHDIFISTAAVADYRPAHSAAQKLKKAGDKQPLALNLSENPDILASVSGLDSEKRPFCVGFAAETEKLATHAQAKLKRKQLDMIAANAVDRADIGFDSDSNALSVYWQGGMQTLAKAPKTTIAAQLLELIYVRYQARLSSSDHAQV